jgi:alpha/beta superfamily hydrolase
MIEKYHIIILSVIMLIILTGCGGGSPVSPPLEHDTNDPGWPDADPGHWAPVYQYNREQVKEAFWLTTPDGTKLHLMLYRPSDSSAANQYPGVILVQGGDNEGLIWENMYQKTNTFELVRTGLIILTFDPRGRGLSEGIEDYYGKTHQDDFKLIIEWFNERPDIIPGGVGVASYSFGITLSVPTLGRYPELPARFLLDCEGAIDRYYCTNWDEPKYIGLMRGHDSTDDEFWEYREPIDYISSVACPYFRLETDYNHYTHRLCSEVAITMINSAINGASPFVQLNDNTPNVILDVSRADEYNWFPNKLRMPCFFYMILHAVSVTTMVD